MPKTHDEPCSTCSSGPSWYIDNQDVKLAPDDKIEVKGSRITFEGHSAIVASEAKKGDEVLVLRNSSGFPRLERLPVHPVHKTLKLVLLADRGDRAERAETKESPVFMRILGYVTGTQQLEKFGVGRIPPSPPVRFSSDNVWPRCLCVGR